MDPSLSVIRKRGDFLAANRGLRVARPGFVLLAHPNDGRGKRYGITVTKKIGNAVVRNRMKRRFRELLWDALPDSGLPDHDHVLIGRAACGSSGRAGSCRRPAAITLRAASMRSRRWENTARSRVDGWHSSVYCAATHGAATATIRCPSTVLTG